MSNKVDALKRVAVALGYGSNVSEYTGHTVADVLREMAVKMQCAPSTANIKAASITQVLNYIADNYGTEEREPYNLTLTGTHATLVVKRNGVVISAASDLLYNGDKLEITATPATGYDLTTLTVNGTTIESGSTYTVNGHNVAIVATGTLQTFDLARTATNATVTVTKGGEAVNDGENVLSYGDEVVITAAAAEGYELTTFTVNGETFVSGETVTVSADVAIIATGTQEETE